MKHKIERFNLKIKMSILVNMTSMASETQKFKKVKKARKSSVRNMLE